MHGAKYGQLTKCESSAVRRADIIGFPQTRLIIEAQACLLGLLRRLVDQILEGIDQDMESSSAKWTELAYLDF